MSEQVGSSRAHLGLNGLIKRRHIPNKLFAASCFRLDPTVFTRTKNNGPRLISRPWYTAPMTWVTRSHCSDATSRSHITSPRCPKAQWKSQDKLPQRDALHLLSLSFNSSRSLSLFLSPLHFNSLVSSVRSSTVEENCTRSSSKKRNTRQSLQNLKA